MSFQNSTKIGPYYMHNTPGEFTRTAGGETFRVFISAAYNALGLIGSEHNGVVVLNDTRMAVVADNLERGTSGYHGALPGQIRLFEKMRAWDDDEFLSYLAGHPFTRENSIPR